MARNSKTFEGLLDRYFETYFEEHPADAAYAGLSAGEGRLNPATLPFLKKQHARRLKALAELDGIAPSTLGSEQHLDRLAFQAQLMRECEDFESGRQAMNPSAIDGVLNVLLKELQRGGDDPKRAARNIRSLLGETPRHLDNAANRVTRPERVWRSIMAASFKASDVFFDAVASFLKPSGSRVADDARLIASASSAFQRYHDTVMDRQLAPTGSFAIGKAKLQRRIRDELGLDYTVGQVEALALAEVDRVGGLLKKACAPFGRKQAVEKIVASARNQWEPKGNLLTLYNKVNVQIIRQFKAARAMTFPKGDSLEITLVPEFMRHVIPMAAYSPPGPFEKKQRGIFWVNDLGLAKKSAAEKLAERQQHFGLELTCAHEAYPGHHLQFVTANTHKRKWRPLFEHAIFYEGWTLWCEQMCADLGILDTPELKIQQLHDALWRCHRILVDLRLQTSTYTHRQAVRHMQSHLGFTRARAEADVNWYTGSPGVPMSYWLGRLENERLRRRLVDGRGWSLRRFNDWLLSFGTLPQAWIEKYGLD